MEFYDIVDQVLALIQQRGRVSYSAVKLQFKLDDETLAALKDELLFSHPVVDENDRGLVWSDKADSEPEISSKPTQPIAQEKPVTQVESLPTPEPRTPEAERRQLTVLFCDLVESTALSGRLDPEDLREVIQSYQSGCTEVIKRFDGHVAQLLGDGLLVYFGYPQAHEDDAQRAVHAGLGMLEAMSTLNSQLQDMRLAIRVGIHTGLVVVGEMGGEGRQEQLALGETPNIAARIQGLAEPDTVAMSEATSQLVQGFFHCEEWGEQNLRGVAQPINVYRVLQETGAQSRLDIASMRGLTPLVGRELEVTLLLDRWYQAETGSGQVVLLSGEAGIGKSRLVQVLKEHIATISHVRLEGRSSPYYQNTALYPITDLIQRTLRWEPDDTAEVKLSKLEQALRRYQPDLEETVPIFAALLSLPVPEDQYPQLSLTPQRQRQKTLETLVAIFVEESERQPVLFMVEDLHWTDPTTLEFLELLIDQSATVSILMLLTCRPEFEPTWSHRAHLAELSLSRLSHAQIEQMVKRVANGKRLPGEVMRELIEKTDGVPLYLEEVTKSVMESGSLREHDDHYELTGSVASLAIPATLQDSLMARLDRLTSAKSVAQLGAVIGRQFSYELLHAVSELDEAILQHELSRLVEAELLYQRGIPPQATYIYKHALVQDTAYESLLRTAREGYHRHITTVLSEQFPDVVEIQPELLAHHYTQAGLNEHAVKFLQKSGAQAIQRSANVEVVAHLTQALSILQTLPDTLEHAQLELDLQVALGPAMRATKGNAAPETGRIYGRARELCQQLGNTEQLFPVLRGLMLHYGTVRQDQAWEQLGEELLDLAQSQVDPAFRMLAHYQLGIMRFFRGKLDAAYTHHREAASIYVPQDHQALAVRYGTDLGVGSHCFLSWDLWLLGYADQAKQHSQTACAMAQEMSHAYSMGQALNWACQFHQFRRDAVAVGEQSTELIKLATEQGFTERLASAKIWHGWSLAMSGEVTAGLDELRGGLAQNRDTSSEYPCFLGLLAEAYEAGSYYKESLLSLREALDIVNDIGDHFFTAELHRLHGSILLHPPNPDTDQAENEFHKAIEIARQQEAKSFELRAAASLAKLWQSQGKHQEAYNLLAPVYGWFTEGFDTADLQDAKALLDELEH